MAVLNIPENALPYLLIQRTKLQRWNPNHYRIVHRLRIPYERTLAHWEARFRAEGIRAGYSAWLEDDYTTFRAVLPPVASHILDIGCGMAGIDVLLFRHYQQSAQLQFHLLDRTEINDAGFTYGMGGADRFYGSLETAHELLRANGIADNQIHLLNVQPGFELTAIGQFDIVISLWSWGFHFPLGTYLEGVYKALRPGGVLILDLRYPSPDHDLFKARFSDWELVMQGNRRIRYKGIK